MKAAIAIFLFILSVFLIGQNLDKEFWGEHDWNGVRYGNIARNYLKYGLLNLKFAQIENSGFAAPNEYEYFTHYPPLLPILISISYSLLGISEWSTRLTPLLVSAGIITFIFYIGSYLWNIKSGLLAAFLGLFTPAVLYFGKTPVHEPLVVFFVLLTFYGYLLKNKLVLLLGLILALLTTWAGFFLVPAITLVELIRKNYQEVKSLLPYWFLSLILFLFYLGYNSMVTGDFFGGNLIVALLQRSGISESGKIQDFNLLSYIDRIRLWFSILYTNTLLSLVLLWIVSRIKGKENKDYLILILGIFGITYFIFFPNAGFIHNYLSLYLLPFFALAAARGLIFLSNLKLFRRIYFVLILLFLLGVFFERRGYLSALEKSDNDKLAVEVGKAIREQTNFNDTVIISPVKFSYSADKFLRFYSDRKIKYSDEGIKGINVLVKVYQDEGKFEIIRVK